eukprot:CAMPEP_0201566346 /NCGR_PEP_ID=MMETSP0190_2-20130828/6080_1 /ASSEMBLY_ACC=CAM_ASM_000263 /TAXON_ID=37353 /ORGANISM="Rosalina sp." /LENGTH=87 /DNA_ID=CAMNT_0047984941 /DNA_START=311 /DNA_END=571 /DNA_ORIENTATION=+
MEEYGIIIQKYLHLAVKVDLHYMKEVELLDVLQSLIINVGIDYIDKYFHRPLLDQWMNALDVFVSWDADVVWDNLKDLFKDKHMMPW